MTEHPKKEIPQRPQRVKGETILIKTACGNAYVTVSTDPNYPAEVFGILGKTGGCAAAQLTSLTRLATKARLYGMPTSEVIRQLKGTQCPNSSDFLPSCPEAIARALEEINIYDPVHSSDNSGINVDKGTIEETTTPGGIGAGEESGE